MVQINSEYLDKYKLDHYDIRNSLYTYVCGNIWESKALQDSESSTDHVVRLIMGIK